MEKTNVYGVVLAGGKGTRMGNVEKPKQFMEVGGKPIIIHTLEKFVINPQFERVIVLSPKQWITYTRDIIRKYILLSDKIDVIEGGATRNDTIMNAISHIEKSYGLDDETIIVTHDSVRPFVTHRILEDNIRYAKELGCVIKLLGVARNTENGIEVSVRPMLIPETHALATVNDSFNAVFLTGDAVGDAMFYGRGAGELPTASAIAGDVFDVARNIVFECTGRIGCTCYKQLPLKAADEMESRFFLRMHVSDCAGTLASIASVFGNNNVSIAQVIQKNKEGELAELVVVTSKVKEGNFNDAMMIIEGMSVVQKVSKVIRVYGD